MPDFNRKDPYLTCHQFSENFPTTFWSFPNTFFLPYNHAYINQSFVPYRKFHSVFKTEVQKFCCVDLTTGHQEHNWSVPGCQLIKKIRNLKFKRNSLAIPGLSWQFHKTSEFVALLWGKINWNTNTGFEMKIPAISQLHPQCKSLTIPWLFPDFRKMQVLQVFRVNVESAYLIVTCTYSSDFSI